MPTALVESSSTVHEHVGSWCLFHEIHAFRAIVRVESAAARRSHVRATLRVCDLAPGTIPPGVIGPGHTFDVSAARDCWNQIWTLFPLSSVSLDHARDALREACPSSLGWPWLRLPSSN